MKYYRAKDDAVDYKAKHCLIKGELLTEKERMKYYPNLSDNAFEIVYISKSLTFTCFGVRKQISESMYDAVFKKCGVE